MCSQRLATLQRFNFSLFFLAFAKAPIRANAAPLCIQQNWPADGMTRPKPRPLPTRQVDQRLRAYALSLLTQFDIGGPRQRLLVADVIAYTAGVDLHDERQIGEKSKWAVRYAFSWIRSQLADLALALGVPFEGRRGNFRYGKEWKIATGKGVKAKGMPSGITELGTAAVKKVRNMYLRRE